MVELVGSGSLAILLATSGSSVAPRRASSRRAQLGSGYPGNAARNAPAYRVRRSSSMSRSRFSRR